MCGVLCVCAELSCFAVASCARTMVSEDVRLALAFIILLRLAGISHCFSTLGAGSLFHCLAALLGLSSGRRALCVCCHGTPT